jgi:hypothetical protein
MIINVDWSSCKVPFVLSDFKGLELPRQIFEKFSNTRFDKYLYVGAELFHADERMDGQTERHEDTNSLFSQFCERA